MLGESLELLKVKPPVVFVGECGMALEQMQGICASSRHDGGHLMVFLKLRWEPGASSRVTMGLFFKHSRLVSSDTSGFSLSHGRAVGMPLELRRATQGPFPVATGILEFLLISKRN